MNLQTIKEDRSIFSFLIFKKWLFTCFLDSAQYYRLSVRRAERSRIHHMLQLPYFLLADPPWQLISKLLCPELFRVWGDRKVSNSESGGAERKVRILLMPQNWRFNFIVITRQTRRDAPKWPNLQICTTRGIAQWAHLKQELFHEMICLEAMGMVPKDWNCEIVW